MEKSNNAAARALAAIALAAAVVLLIAVIAGSLGEDSGSGGSGKNAGEQTVEQRPKTKAASYVVETGDTLTSIARDTGIPVATILKMNPEVDPHILIAGEKLKLR